MDAPVDRLNPTRQTYGDLQRAYEHFNARLFNDRLPNCLITLRATGRSLGYFAAERFVDTDGGYVHEIALNPAGFACRSVEVSLSTMAHEMSHLAQFIDKAVGRRTYHNADFAERMEAIGLIPSSTGRPGGKKTGQNMTHYIDPDGRFLVAALELMADGFRARWAERFTGAIPLAWTPDETPRPAALTSRGHAVAPDSDEAGDDDGETAVASAASAPADGDAPPEPLAATRIIAPDAKGRLALNGIPFGRDAAPGAEPLPYQPLAPPPAYVEPSRFVGGSQQAAVARKSTRSKYACECGQSARGKPKQLFLCAVCQKPLEETPE